MHTLLSIIFAQTFKSRRVQNENLARSLALIEFSSRAKFLLLPFVAGKWRTQVENVSSRPSEGLDPKFPSLTARKSSDVTGGIVATTIPSLKYERRTLATDPRTCIRHVVTPRRFVLRVARPRATRIPCMQWQPSRNPWDAFAMSRRDSVRPPSSITIDRARHEKLPTVYFPPSTLPIK